MRELIIIIILTTAPIAVTSGNYQDSCKILISKFYQFIHQDEVTNMELESVFYAISYEKEIRNNANFLPTDNSLFHKKIKLHAHNITNGLDLSSINAVIDNAACYISHNKYTVIVELKLNSKQSCSFEINRDKPYLIQNIWLGDGRSLISLIMNYKPIDLLLRPALISDKDGYTNIRKERSAKSEIVGVLHNGEQFFYVQNYYSDWLEVYKNNSHAEKSIGFIHKSRIVKIEEQILMK